MSILQTQNGIIDFQFIVATLAKNWLILDRA